MISDIPKEPVKCAITRYDCKIHAKNVSLPNRDKLLPFHIDTEHSDVCVTFGLSQSSIDRHLDAALSTPRYEKPSALISPVANTSACKSVQTDSLSIDLNELLHVDDIVRSNRLLGLLSHRSVRRRAVSDDFGGEIDSLREEIKSTNSNLQSQRRVNEDIKKLLVASMGDNLAYKVDRLCQERACLVEEVAALRCCVAELSEQADRASIEADLWRSKFVAGRVMLDELAGRQALISRQHEAAVAALRALLSPTDGGAAETGEPHTIPSTIDNDSTTILSPMPTAQSVARAQAFRVLASQSGVAGVDNTRRYVSAYRSVDTRVIDFATMDACKRCRGGEVKVV